jgi:hypothetical protein
MENALKRIIFLSGMKIGYITLDSSEAITHILLIASK